MTSKTFNLKPSIILADLGIYLEESKTLIISDIHIGYEESLVKQGILIPKFHFKDVVKRAESLLKLIKNKPLELIIVNGDLKHEFGTISDEEWRNTLKFLDFLSRYAKLILVKGNHDTILGPIAEKRNVEVVNHIILDDIIICHGDKLIDIPKFINTIIIGHDHPAISLKDGPRVETYKTFLFGKYSFGNKKIDLIVMPSFHQLVEGTDVHSEKMLSPFLQKNLKNFEVFVVGDEIYDFGKISALTKKLSK